MSKYGRFYMDNLEHKLLHRLPYSETTTPCGLFDVAMVDQLFFDSVRFSGADKCAPCFQNVEFTDVHTEHCCSKHGCKYGEKLCTVTRGVHKQSHPCEFCSMDEEEMEERGEVWQYGIVGEYGTPDLEGSFGGNIDALKPGKPRPKLASGVKIVRRRVSQWEEVG